MSSSSAARKLRAQAPLFAALGDETRLSLVARLADGRARSIARLTLKSNMTRQAITKHLHVLEEAGVVRGVRSGRQIVFALEPASLDGAKACLDQISAECDDALSRLKSFVEK